MIIVRLKSFFDYDTTLNQREIIIDRAINHIEALRAENARLQIQCDEAYLNGMKHGWNCCAANDADRYYNSIENTREQIRAARAAMGESDERV